MKRLSRKNDEPEIRILVLHGPNLNMLGRREPEQYGRVTLEEIDDRLKNMAAEMGLLIECRQSNHEGQLIDILHSSRDDAVIINPGALTHYSYALADALRSIDAYKVEVHLTNIHSREEFRQISVTGTAVHGIIAGFGVESYTAALKLSAEHLRAKR